MSNIICFLTCKNLFKGQNAIGYTEQFIANYAMKSQAVFSMLLCSAFMVVKSFLRFKNEKVEYIYNIMIEMFRNEQAIRNFFQFGCTNSVIEILTCYSIKRSFETGRGVGFKEIVGYLIAPTVIRVGLAHMLNPTPDQLIRSFERAVIRVEDDKIKKEIKKEREARHRVFIFLLYANNYDDGPDNYLKLLPTELIRTVNEYL